MEEAIEDMMVVSDMGEQWSPKTVPLRMEPIDAYRTAEACSGGSPAESCSTGGTDMGNRMAMLPHEVPVAKAITEETIKMTRGRA